MLFEDGGWSGWGAASTCCLETHHGFEWVVDPPLETCEGTDHNDSCEEARPESRESDLSVDFAHLFAEASTFLSLTVEFAHHGISWVRDDGAEDTSEVSWEECDTELGSLGVILFSLREVVSIEVGNEPFEGDELDDGVWNLSTPKWTKTLIESVGSWVKS